MRPIDADALKAKLKFGTNTATYSDYCNGYCDARQVDLDAIDAAPTIDPEVLHGRWIQRRNGKYYCDNCGREERFIFHKNYCPKCGAKMDGKDGEKNG